VDDVAKKISLPNPVKCNILMELRVKITWAHGSSIAKNRNEIINSGIISQKKKNPCRPKHWRTLGNYQHQSIIRKLSCSKSGRIYKRKKQITLRARTHPESNHENTPNLNHYRAFLTQNVSSAHTIDNYDDNVSSTTIHILRLLNLSTFQSMGSFFTAISVATSDKK
jgi:hypothetical protein